MENQTKDKAQGKLAKVLLVSYAMRKVSYMIRILAGGYLVYLMYQLFSESHASEETLTPLMITAGVVMIVAGIYFVIGGLYALLNGIYEENDPAKIEADEAGTDEIGSDEIEADGTEAVKTETDKSDAGIADVEHTSEIEK